MKSRIQIGDWSEVTSYEAVLVFYCLLIFASRFPCAHARKWDAVSRLALNYQDNEGIDIRWEAQNVK